MVINIHSFISVCESEERGRGKGGGVYAPLESDTPRNVVVNRSFFFPFQVCTVKVCVHKHLREDLVIPRKTKGPGDGVSVTKKVGHPPLSDTTRPKKKSSTLIEPVARSRDRSPALPGTGGTRWTSETLHLVYYESMNRNLI